MCMCDRLSRVLTDIEVIDRERANMEGEVGAWRVFSAGLEKERIDGLCPTCEKKESKNKKATTRKKKENCSGSCSVEKRGATAAVGEGGVLLKHKRPYKRRKQEHLSETIIVKHYTRASRTG